MVSGVGAARDHRPVAATARPGHVVVDAGGDRRPGRDRRRRPRRWRWRREPDRPTIVCLQAGNVNTGACDDFRRVIPLAREARRVGARRRRFRAVGGGPPSRCATSSTVSSSPTPGRPTATSGSTSPTTAGCAICARPALHATRDVATPLRTSPAHGAVRLLARRPGARVVAASPGLRDLGGAARARPLGCRRPGRPVLRARPPVRRAARRGRRDDRQRRGAQPGAGGLRRRRAHRRGRRRGPARRYVLARRHHLARPAPDARLGVQRRRTTEADVDRSAEAILAAAARVGSA